MRNPSGKGAIAAENFLSGGDNVCFRPAPLAKGHRKRLPSQEEQPCFWSEADQSGLGAGQIGGSLMMLGSIKPISAVVAFCTSST